MIQEKIFIMMNLLKEDKIKKLKAIFHRSIDRILINYINYKNQFK